MSDLTLVVVSNCYHMNLRLDTRKEVTPICSLGKTEFQIYALKVDYLRFCLILIIRIYYKTYGP